MEEWADAAPRRAPTATIFALALSSAAAFVAPAPAAASTRVSETKADLVALCENNPTALPFDGIWDPLGCADYDFWGLGNEATIGYLRHAEIKHGRVAMAGFLGFLAQSTPLVSGEHVLAPYKGYVAGCTPQVQWDNIPLIGKLQILTLIGMLESYGEGAGAPDGYVHYLKGGQPGYFPPIAGRAGFGQVTLNLWDPFELPGGPSSLDAAGKARGLFAEINNGRLAMIGILSVLAESAMPGSNPIFKVFQITMPAYDGNVMASVFPLDSPFVVDTLGVLAVCGFLQQLKNGAVQKLP
ncbi:chlorophyll a/b-binding protein-domain-containing protein [Pelagophyceae sp. CCMP2097]|nr:chlorophyll a/b-binding protein-domain-containing protein [Pelagophyceae sp. CCMP2097]